MAKGLLIAIALTAPITTLAQEAPLVIPREQAECISNIVALETLIETDPVLIRLKTCPDIIAGARDLMELSQNTSPGILTPRTGDGVEVLILTRQEVICVIDQIRRRISATPDIDPVTIDMTQCVDA